ncbi:OmpA/MotB domain-containing protein [Candidatus Magnetoovum chiemensis]|nr:OmpA/MotB domain-containing protein [Candidatus Magnetoovum chiemensis]
MEDAKEEEGVAVKEREDMLKQMEGTSNTDKVKAVTKEVVVDKNLSGNNEIANKIKSEIEAKLADIKDQIIVEPFKNFVRIEVIDKAGNPIFDIGSVEPTEEARKILKVIADSIKTLDVMLTIEGHTDARQYPSQNYTNWELSTGRASTFRIILGEEGVDSKRLISVSGLADTMPRIKNNPLSPFNRRVSILLYPKGQGDKNKVEQK